MAPGTKGRTRTSVRKSPLKKSLLNMPDTDGPTWVRNHSYLGYTWSDSREKILPRNILGTDGPMWVKTDKQAKK